MSILNCTCKRDCVLWALVISVALGILAAFLRITAVITVAPVALIVAFGIAVGYLAVAVYVGTRANVRAASDCLCNAVSAVLTGALGTILTSVILLAISFVATSVIGAIITGLLVASFSLTVTSTACLAKCLLDCDA